MVCGITAQLNVTSVVCPQLLTRYKLCSSSCRNEPIPHVLQKLVVEGFSGMPVISAGRRFIGQIDILDILWHTLITFKAWSKETPDVKPQQLDRQSARKYWEQFMGKYKIGSSNNYMQLNSY